MRPHLHDFRDASLLEQALTHASCGPLRTNERLEFLGDALLGHFAAEELFRRLPQQSEGELSTRKAWLVSRPVLAIAAQRLELHERAQLGQGLDRDALPSSVLANLFEAVLAAIYLDSGWRAARDFAQLALARELERCCAGDFALDPKQELQQWTQQRALGLPRYALLEQSGEAHARQFQIAVEIAEERFEACWGRSRKEAERLAARAALDELARRSSIEEHARETPAGEAQRPGASEADAAAPAADPTRAEKPQA